MEPRSPSKTKVPILVFFHHFRVLKLTLTILLVLLLLFTGVYLIRNLGFVPNTSYFTVVLDCGSSGTRVNVYEWILRDNLKLPMLLRSYPDNSTKGNARKDGCAYHCMQTEPGLDKFTGNASGVKASVEPLIRRAERWVPYERRKDTPIFVLATAGLRRLSEESARGVLEDVEDVVKLHEFKYSKDWIRVLSGREEAYYGWIALNYRMGVFGNSSRLATLGLLDLGGSSLQVVTEVKELSIDDEEDDGVFRSKIGSFQILAASLQAFGLNEAFDRTVVMLSRSQVLQKSGFGTVEIGHPCLSSGFMQNYTCHGCFRVNSLIDRNLTNKMRVNQGFSIYLVGEPNWEKCKGLARAVAINSSGSLDWSKLSNDSYCTGLSSPSGEKRLDLVRGAHSAARFHALSGFFAVYSLLNLRPTTNLSKIWKEGQQLCSRSMTGLTNIPIKHKYSDYICFRVPYMATLIENTLCLGDKEIVFGPGDVSWTLGAALVEGKDLRLSNTSKAKNAIFTSRDNRVIFSPYFVFIFLVFLLFVVYRSQIKLPMPVRKASHGTSWPTYIGPKHRPV